MATENSEKLLSPQESATCQDEASPVIGKSNFWSKIKKLSLGLKFLIGGVILWIVAPAFFYLLSAITGDLGYIFISLSQFSVAIGTLGVLIGVTLSFIRFIKHIAASPESDAIANGNNTSASMAALSVSSATSSFANSSRYNRKRLYLVLGILGLLAAPILFFGLQIMIWAGILGDSPSAADTQAAIPLQLFSWVIYIVFNVAGLVLLPLALIQYYRLHKQSLEAAQASNNKAAISQAALRLRDYFKSLAMFILFFPLVLAYLNMMQLAYIGVFSRWALVYYLVFVAAGALFLIRSHAYKDISQKSSV